MGNIIVANGYDDIPQAERGKKPSDYHAKYNALYDAKLQFKIFIPEDNT